MEVKLGFRSLAVVLSEPMVITTDGATIEQDMGNLYISVVPRPSKVIYNGPATIVIWKDGTKTVVKRAEGDSHDPVKAYLEAFYLKATGKSRTQCRKALESIAAGDCR